jgi:signal transduction histidine kinase
MTFELSRLDDWERREVQAMGVLPYVMLVFCAVLTLVLRTSLGGRWPVDLGLCAVAAVWLTGMASLVPARWRGRTPVQAVYFAGLIAIMTTMIALDPWFGFFTYSGYFLVYKLPFTSWRVLGIIVVAVLTGSSQVGGFAAVTHGAAGAMLYVGTVIINIAVAGVVTWFGWVGVTQHQRRAELVQELRSANLQLEATLAENADLHKQLVEQAREAGVRDERQRMAREIHDTLAQGLTGIITQLQAADEAADDPAERRRHFEVAIGLARESLTEARRSVDALRPQPLERTRLAGALRDVAARWTGLHGLAVRFTTTGAARSLPPESEVVLLRVAQEGLANVGKHAAASQVWLTLSYMNDEIALDVSDDGRGFNPAEQLVAAPAAVPGGGFGLTAMRQRVEGLGGTLQVESEPGSGTVISARVPVAAR